jgi:hypothetical protein
MIVAVSVNHSGPYNFLLDTGTQTTMIDPSLAAELHLNTQGSAVVAGVGFHAAASLAQLDSLEAGPHAVANQKVLVFDFQNPQSANFPFHGVLGEDFLGQFDVLIDNAHNRLCLDDSSAMRADVKGSHIPLLRAADTSTAGPSFRSLIISARLSDAVRPVLLKLDSGTNSSFLFDTSTYLPPKFLRNTSLFGAALDGAQHRYAALPLLELQIGPVEIPRASFFTFVGPREDSSSTQFDGMLSTRLFRSVFICHNDHFVILDSQ